MTSICDSSWVYGLLVISGLLGIVGSFIFFLVLVLVTRSSPRQIMDPEWWYTGFATGIVERFFFTTAIGLFGTQGSGLLTAIIGWIAVKGQVHYRMFSESGSRDLAQIYLGVLGSLGSLLFAILGGFAWSSGYTLAHPFGPP
jgi:hypothetical protein